MTINNKKGFTLIELLVVISIISLLTSIILAALSDAKAKGRDARRLQDIHTIQTAITMYQNDNGGVFPGPLADSNGTGTSYSSDPLFLQTLVTGKYIPVVPTDPIGGAVYLYGYSNSPASVNIKCSLPNSKAYILFKLEKTTTSYPPCLIQTSYLCACL